MDGYYGYTCKNGTFKISRGKRKWELVFQNEGLGTYSSPHAAVEDLSKGTFNLPSIGDTSTFKIPELGDWNYHRA